MEIIQGLLCLVSRQLLLILRLGPVFLLPAAAEEELVHIWIWLRRIMELGFLLTVIELYLGKVNYQQILGTYLLS